MVYYLLVIGIVVLAALAVRFYDLLAAAVALSLASVLLALFFYHMGAPMAAVFELSVGAGLVTVLFITAISLVSKARETKSEKRGGLARLTTFLNFCVVGSVFAYAAWVVLGNHPETRPAAEIGEMGAILWGPRALDVLGQAVILFGSILGIILLFRKERGA